MDRNLSHFEAMFDETILERGRVYWREGRVLDIEEVDAGIYYAAVDGSEVYEVNVALDDQGGIREIGCDCPYDWDEHCKHQAAVLFVLREQARQGGNAGKAQPLMERVKGLLEGQTKEALVETLLALVRENPALGNRLLYHLNDGTSAQALVDAMWEAIHVTRRAGKRREYACARDVAGLMDEMLEVARETGPTKDAAVLLLEVIRGCEAMNDAIFDEDDDFSMWAAEAVDRLDELVMDADERGSEPEQEAFCMAIFDGMQALPFRNWDDRLVKCVAQLCALPACRERVGAYWEKRLRELDGTKEHKVNFIKRQQLALLEKYGDEQDAARFIQDNLQHDDFREMAIERAMQKQEYHTVLALALDGERTRGRFYGLQSRWQGYAFEAYKALNDLPQAQKLAREFLLGGDFDYYLWLKQSYSETQWEDVLARLLAELESKRHGSAIYERILVAEALWDKLIAYIEQTPSRVFSLHEHVSARYAERVDAAFYQAIAGIAQQSSNRTAYRDLCARIQTYGSVCGSASAGKLVKRLREVYRNRPAMMDELGKAFLD